LHIASIHGRTDILKDLLERGAKIDQEDHAGKTALLEAIINGHTEAINLLKEKGAKLQNNNHHVTSVLLNAASNVIFSSHRMIYERVSTSHFREISP